MPKLLSIPLLTGLLWAEVPPGDSRRGEEVLRDQGCIGCHSINGRGGTIGPDLGKRIDRNFTPSELAATIWNHAPAMWAPMRRQGIAKATLSRESAADLFAFFYSSRFFDKPGDAARGRAVFTTRHCADCHGLGSVQLAGAPPVNKWRALDHQILLAGNMWNHSGTMTAAFGKRGIPWQSVSSQDLSDLLVYLRNLPETRGRVAAFSCAPAADGETVYRTKCAGCHDPNLDTKPHKATLTDIAASMWNHAPRMQPAPRLSEEEMENLLGYLWTRQFVQRSGKAARGRRVFERKGCANCHGQGGTEPVLTASRPHSDVSMVSAVWEHGPRMLERMNQKRMAWPRFAAGEMPDLIAYLNSLQ